MIWMVLGLMLMSSIYPFHLAVNYFHSKYWSSQGHSNQEKYHHFHLSFIALGKFILLAGIVMFVWGASSTWIKDSYIDNRISDTEYTSPTTPPTGGMVP